jgi:hypothetical protein
MRSKDDILASVARQDATNENHDQYTTRVLKAVLETLLDIRDEMFNARVQTAEERAHK